MMLRSPKIRVLVYLDEHSKPAAGIRHATSVIHYTVCLTDKHFAMYTCSVPADKQGSVRIEQLKLVAPHMTAFVDAMRSALQSKTWERSQPAESSGRSHTTASPSAVASGSNPGAVDESLVDSQLVGMLVAMGFPKHRAARAALETGNTGA